MLKVVWLRKVGDVMRVASGPVHSVDCDLDSDSMRMVKSRLACSGALVTFDPPHKIPVWVGSLDDVDTEFSKQDFDHRFRLLPAEAETTTLAALGLTGGELICLEFAHGGIPMPIAEQRIAAVRVVTAPSPTAEQRIAKLHAVARAHSASSRKTDLDHDALVAVLLHVPKRTWFFAAGRVCRSWHGAAHGTGTQILWRATYSTVSEIKQLAPDSQVVRQWLILHADQAISSLTAYELSSMRAAEDLLVRRIQRKPEEGIKFSVTDSTGAPIDPAPLLTLAEPRVLGCQGARLVQVVVTIEPRGDGSRADVVRHRDRIIGYLKPLGASVVMHQRGSAVLNVWGNVNWPSDAWAPSVIALPTVPTSNDFIPSASFAGHLPGCIFKTGEHGLGYYRDQAT